MKCLRWILDWGLNIWITGWTIVLVGVFCVGTQTVIQLSLVAAVLLTSHALYFFASARQFPSGCIWIFAIFNSLAFLLTILLLNGNGNTWGSGPAIYGLILIFPALNSIFVTVSIQSLSQAKWWLGATGAFGVSYVIWRWFEISRYTGDATYWPPNPFHQKVALAASSVLAAFSMATWLAERLVDEDRRHFHARFCDESKNRKDKR